MLSLPSYIIGLFCRWRWRRVGLSLIDVHTRLALSLGTIRELSKKPPTNSSTSLAGNEKQKNSHCLYKHPSYNIVAITDLLWIFCPCKKLGVTFARSLEKHSVSCYVMRREPCSGLGLQHSPDMLKALQVLPPTYWRRSLLELTPTWHHLHDSEDTDLHSG